MDGGAKEDVDGTKNTTGDEEWVLFCGDTDRVEKFESLVEPVESSCESSVVEPVNSFARDCIVTGIVMVSMVSF
jgi:hypothetical protein